MLDHVLTAFCFVAGTAMFIDFFLVVYLHKSLNAIFDPKFKVNLSKWTWLSWSGRFARANQYATWVAQKSVKHAFVKTAIGYDFRSKVSPELYRLCRVHLFLFRVWFFVGGPIGLYWTFTK